MADVISEMFRTEPHGSEGLPDISSGPPLTETPQSDSGQPSDKIGPYVDPGTEINPKILVVQEGEDSGKIAAVEQSMGEAGETDSTGKFTPTGEKVQMTEGLPVIGADAERALRDSDSPNQFEVWNADPSNANKAIGGFWDMSRAGKDTFYGETGVKAMTEAIGRRAEALVAGASEELVKQVREAAEAAFRSELDSKAAEKQKIADDKARELLAKIQGGTPIDEIIPEEPAVFRSEKIDETVAANHDRTPPMPNSVFGGRWNGM